MKKLLLPLMLCAVISRGQGLPGDSLEINNIRFYVNADGELFKFGTGMQAPAGSGHGTMYAGNLWIGGIDAGNQLHIAAQTYRQTGTDFWPGPLNSMATADSAFNAGMQRVWKLNQCDIDAYHNWVINGAMGTNPVNAQVMNTINNWPAVDADGNPLAQYSDYNSNGTYEPSLGETPVIKGDQAILFIYNDKAGIHGETSGMPLGVEVIGMIYGYSCVASTPLYNTVFANYKIINKSSYLYNNCCVGNWTNFSIGSPYDDYMGSDVMRGSFYAVNGDSVDSEYGSLPPAQAVVVLNGPYADPDGIDNSVASCPNGTNYGDGIVDNERLGLINFIGYANDFSTMGVPTAAIDYYNYMRSRWKDGTHLTYGGAGHLTGSSCNFMFPGNSDPAGYGTSGVAMAPWSEAGEGNPPHNVHALGSVGPFSLTPGAIQSVDYAYVFARAATGSPDSVSENLMGIYVDSIRSRFQGPITGCGCNISTVIATVQKPSISIWPNPATTELHIAMTTGDNIITISNPLGQVLIMRTEKSSEAVMNVGELAAGMYIITIRNSSGTTTQRFLRH